MRFYHNKLEKIFKFSVIKPLKPIPENSGLRGKLDSDYAITRINSLLRRLIDRLAVAINHFIPFCFK